MAKQAFSLKKTSLMCTIVLVCAQLAASAQSGAAAKPSSKPWMNSSLSPDERAAMARYRERLYEIGLQIAREESAARELADSLYADLYGTVSREGRRVSKLSSYTGRGSLEGWLRTVMAQEQVNRYRRQKRMVSLEEETEEGAQFATPDPEPISVVDPRLESATDEALSALPAEDRFVLAAYFLDGRTLAEIARMLSVHVCDQSARCARFFVTCSPDEQFQKYRRQIYAFFCKSVVYPSAVRLLHLPLDDSRALQTL